MDLISIMAEKGFLASPDLNIKEEEINEFLDFLTNLKEKPIVISNDLYKMFLRLRKKYEIVKVREKIEEISTKVKIKKSVGEINKKKDIVDWITYYFDRYNKIKTILQNREELKGSISISRIKKINGRQKVSFIGMVKDIKKTFSGVSILSVEDPTGIINVVLRNEIKRIINEIVYDEVIGVVGTKSKDVVYAEKIIFPEVPQKTIKKCEDDVYAVFISDTHVGSSMFLAKEFKQFISWINGKIGTKEQIEMAKKVKYLFIAGDLVDGVGIYPEQEKELVIKDIYEQYKEITKYLLEIPKEIEIIIIPGNHDAAKISEPQPPLFKDIAGVLYDLENVTILSNPSIVNIHNIRNFPGFDILIYHGSSFDYLVSEVSLLRKYGYSRADKVMEFLLKKRHLAPPHGSTRIDPTPQDFLVIDKIPDIFVSGHIHYTSVGRYKNIMLINSGCFQDKTEFQIKLGHNPTPGRVPVFSLKQNKVKIMRFR